MNRIQAAIITMSDSRSQSTEKADESGAVIKTYEYDSFGNEVNPDRKDENPFRYCGEIGRASCRERV